LAVGIRITLAGVSRSQFDELNERLNPHRVPPKGLLFHASGPSEEEGWRVIDFWESQADFDSYREQLLGADVVAGLEMAAPPEIKVFPVHEFICA
jgi:hypothetical protein